MLGATDGAGVQEGMSQKKKKKRNMHPTGRKQGDQEAETPMAARDQCRTWERNTRECGTDERNKRERPGGERTVGDRSS